MFFPRVPKELNNDLSLNGKELLKYLLNKQLHLRRLIRRRHGTAACGCDPGVAVGGVGGPPHVLPPRRSPRSLPKEGRGLTPDTPERVGSEGKPPLCFSVAFTPGS